jgi:hypothetical protein
VFNTVIEANFVSKRHDVLDSFKLTDEVRRQRSLGSHAA